MIETCLQRIRKINPGDVQFYMWIRRLFDSIDLRVHLDSIYMKKRNDVIQEYQQLMPLIYTCFEKFLAVDALVHPPELEGLLPSRVIAMSKEYDLNTIEGVTESVGSILQLLELYANANSESDCRFIDLFYVVIYQLLYNIHIIIDQKDGLKEYDVRSVLYVKGIRP